MFSLVGVLMTLYGLVTNSNAEMYQRSLGLNVNFYWGLVLLVFGGAMLLMAWRGSRAAHQPKLPESQSKSDESTARR
jgi:protein-S-isoprenylcysteine O-methyltransferase Ste14